MGKGKLIHAIRKKNHTEVEQLLRGEYKNSIHVNETDPDGYTPAHFAARLGQADTITLLADAKADFNLVTTYGLTPLYYAAYHNYEFVIEALVAGGANVDQRIKDDATAVFFAAENGSARAVEALIEANADLNISRSWDGATPIFVAAEYGNDTIVNMLLDGDADYTKATLDGTTPLTIAKRNGHQIVVDLLETRIQVKSLAQQNLAQRLENVVGQLNTLSLNQTDNNNNSSSTAVQIIATTPNVSSFLVNHNQRVHPEAKEIPAIINKAITKFNPTLQMGNYYHEITRQQAEAILKLGKKPGIFLLRPGMNSGTIAISYLNSKREMEDMVIKTNSPLMDPEILGAFLQEHNALLKRPVEMGAVQAAALKLAATKMNAC